MTKNKSKKQPEKHKDNNPRIQQKTKINKTNNKQKKRTGPEPFKKINKDNSKTILNGLDTKLEIKLENFSKEKISKNKERIKEIRKEIAKIRREKIKLLRHCKKNSFPIGDNDQKNRYYFSIMSADHAKSEY